MEGLFCIDWICLRLIWWCLSFILILILILVYISDLYIDFDELCYILVWKWSCAAEKITQIFNGFWWPIGHFFDGFLGEICDGLWWLNGKFSCHVVIFSIGIAVARRRNTFVEAVKSGRNAGLYSDGSRRPPTATSRRKLSFLLYYRRKFNVFNSWHDSHQLITIE